MMYVQVKALFVVIFGINTTSDSSSLERSVVCADWTRAQICYPTCPGGTPHHQRKCTNAPKHEMNYVSTEIDLVTVFEAILTSRQPREKLVGVIAWFVVIFGINTSSDISKLLYVISQAAGRVKFETILKCHDWYVRQISRTNHAIICLYYYPQKACNFHM